MKQYLVECVGSLFFVLIIGLAVRFAGNLAPLVIGFALMVLVYAGGHISGAHYNPAVTLGLAVSKKQSRSQVIPYWVSQVVGAVLGGIVVKRLLGAALTTAVLDPSVAKVIISEFLFTFALVYVVHNVAATKSKEGNSFYGLAIGCMVLVGAFCVGSISGGSFNPAVSIGSWFDGLFATGALWQHIVGQLLGAIAAGLFFGVICDPQDKFVMKN